MGFLFIGFLSNSMEGYRSTVIYIFIYAVMSAVLLSIFISARKTNKQQLDYLTDFRGFGVSN